jgi:hypothetical protein
VNDPAGVESDVGRWLALLRDGSEEERQLARTELGLILESRGLLDDAVEAYERNVQAGVSDRRPYERLAALARARGDAATEARVLRALADLLAPRDALTFQPVAVETLAAQPAAVEALTPQPLRGANLGYADVPLPTVGEGEAQRGVAESDDGEPEGGPQAAPAGDEAWAREMAGEAMEVTGDAGEMAGGTSPAPTEGQVERATNVGAQFIAPDPPDSAETAGVPEPVDTPDSTDASRLTDAPSVANALDASDAPDPVDVALVDVDEATPSAEQSQPQPDPEVTADSDLGAAPVPDTSHERSDKSASEDPGIALHHELELHLEEERRRAARGHPPTVPRSTRGLVALAALVPILVIVVGAALYWPGAPEARPVHPPAATPTVLLTPASPSPVELRLVAELSSPSPSPAATETPRSTLTPTLTPTPLPAHCADAELRFPESRDSESAVRAAYRDYLARQGVTLGASDAAFSRLGEAYAARHAEVVAGWMAVTLQRERRGLSAFSLVDYVASDVMVATAPGEYQLRATISPQGWNEIRAWPADSCEGAFIRNPANAPWVELMQANVGDITWALPTPAPSR